MMPTALRHAALGGLFVLAAIPAVAQQASLGRETIGGDADRLVAERVLRLGGAVILEGQRRPILDLDELPDAPFRLHTLDLAGVSMGAWGLKDELSRLPPIPHLKELYINGRLWYNQPVSLVADTIGLFSSASDLEKLVISKPVQTYIPLDDSVLERLAVLPGVEEMRLHQTRLPGSALEPFTNLKYVIVGKLARLEDLYVNFGRFSDTGLKALAGLAQLKRLGLGHTKVTNAGMETVGKLALLESLDLGHTNVSDAGIAKLTGLSRLATLELDSVDLTDAGIAHLAALRSLKELDLYHTLVSESGFQQLKTTLPDCRTALQGCCAGAGRPEGLRYQTGADALRDRCPGRGRVARRRADADCFVHSDGLPDL